MICMLRTSYALHEVITNYKCNKIPNPHVFVLWLWCAKCVVCSKLEDGIVGMLGLVEYIGPGTQSEDMK